MKIERILEGSLIISTVYIRKVDIVNPGADFKVQPLVKQLAGGCQHEDRA